MASDLEIRSIDSRRGWKDFYRVKCDIYRGDPAAVVPLRSMEYALLDDQKHPFYLHAQRQAFVAYQSGKPVARIVAVKDDMHNEHYGDRVGFFGFFECPDDQVIAAALIDTAKQWLLDRGLDRMRGPVNPSMKSEFGVLVEGHDRPPYVMMAHSKSYYARLLESAGFEVARRFVAYFVENTPENRKTIDQNMIRLQKFADRVFKRFPNVRLEYGTKETVEKSLREVNKLGNVVRSEGWGFVPMTDKELDFMVSQVKRIINPKTIVLAYLDDKLAGYHVSVPDINWAVKKTRGPDWLRFLQLAFWLKKIPRTRCIALGAAKEHRRTGIGMLVAREMTKLFNTYQEWEFSWIDEENQLSMGTITRSVPAHRYKTYHLYEKAIG